MLEFEWLYNDKYCVLIENVLLTFSRSISSLFLNVPG